jgi:molecular chaperone DnaK
MDSAGASEIEAAIAEAKKVTTEGDVEAMNNAFNRLQTASHKLAEALYQQTGAGAGGEGSADDQANAAGASSGSSSSQGTGGDDNVIDAEYVDVDENK